MKLRLLRNCPSGRRVASRFVLSRTFHLPPSRDRHNRANGTCRHREDRAADRFPGRITADVATSSYSRERLDDPAGDIVSKRYFSRYVNTTALR